MLKKENIFVYIMENNQCINERKLPGHDFCGVHWGSPSLREGEGWGQGDRKDQVMTETHSPMCTNWVSDRPDFQPPQWGISAGLFHLLSPIAYTFYMEK